jgi:integrase
MKGYFRKRGTKWSFSVDIGRDAGTGKRKQKTVSGFKTKKEAEKSCAELISQIENGNYVENTKDTLSSFLNDWLEMKGKQTLKATTLDTYTRTINSRISPAIGKMKLFEIQPIHIQRFYSDLFEEGLSHEYVLLIHRILRSAFNTAYKWQLLQKNVMDHVEIPKVPKKEMKTWTLEQAQKFLSYVNETDAQYYIAYYLAIYTGMRRGEIFGLRWKSIDFDNYKISITQTLSWVSGKGLIFQDAKTRESHRSISISTSVVEELKIHQEEQNKQKLRLGAAYTDNDLVCPSSTGHPANTQIAVHYFKVYSERAGVPVIRFHDLRHTHATLLLKLGENPKVVSERLGHSTIQLTLDRYSHVLPDMQKEASSKFERAMKNTL